MKRIVYSILLLLALCPACSFAQGRFMYGITAGFDYGAQSDFYSHSNLGLIAGIGIGYFNWDHYSYCVQLLFDQKGNMKSYLEIPLTIKIPFTTIDKSKPYIFAGPTFGFLLSSYGEEFTYGLYAGIGVTAPISTNIDFLFEVGYAQDLEGLFNTINIDGFVTHRASSQDVRIYVGMLFGK